MKYVVNNDQFVAIDGTINIGNPKYDGIYNDQNIQLTEDFLRLEHTDGLNYLNIEVKRFDNIDHWFGLNSKNFQINLTEGFGAGVLYPKTNSTLLSKKQNDEFHLAGFGLSLKTGINLTLFNHFFVQAEFKAGYIDMSDIRTTTSTADSASQEFFFFQRNISFGYIFQLVK